GGVETLHAQDQVGGVGVLVLQPVGDDLGGGGVADLQAVRAGLEGQRVGVEVLAVGVVGGALEEQRGPPVVGGDRLVEVVGDLRDDGGAGDVAGAGGSGRQFGGVAAGAESDLCRGRGRVEGEQRAAEEGGRRGGGGRPPPPRARGMGHGAPFLTWEQTQRREVWSTSQWERSRT